MTSERTGLRATRRAASVLRRPVRPSRDGRLLVECMVSMLLLAIAGLALSSSTRALALLGDDAVLVGQAHSLAVTAAEAARWGLCSANGSERQRLPRVQLVAVRTREARLQRMSLTSILAPSPLGVGRGQPLRLDAARLCE